MSTITKERIANLIEFNSEGSDCQANAEQWEVHELARIALASLEAEPVSFDDLRDAVAEVSGGPAMEWNDIYKGHQAVPFINFNSLARIVDKFRTAPPAPVSEMIIWPTPHKNNQSQGWKVCPDFLLQIREKIGDDEENYDLCPSLEMVEAVLLSAAMLQAGNGVTNGKPLTITLPDISSKAFWSATGKNETFHPETYRRWVKEAIERSCTIAHVDVEVK